MVLRDTIQTNERELRRWDHALVNEMVDAVVFSLRALEPWMPWALTSLGANDRRMASAKGRNDFDEGKAWNYRLFWRNTGQFVESAGRHREDDRDCPEIGDWIRTDRTQKGRATESARALVETVITYLLEVQRVKICVDQANVASAAVTRNCDLTWPEWERAIEATSHTGKVFVWLQRRFDPKVRAD